MQYAICVLDGHRGVAQMQYAICALDAHRGVAQMQHPPKNKNNKISIYK